MDIALKNEDGIFKLRVCGALKVGEKFLLIKHEGSNFFCLPGGHVEHGEDSETAAKREMEEELGFPVKLEKLLGIDQNFFPLSNGKAFTKLHFTISSLLSRKFLFVILNGRKTTREGSSTTSFVGFLLKS